MGGRGATSGTYKQNRNENVIELTYGDEYFSIGRFNTSFGEVKLIMNRDDGPANLPMETMTPGRIYALVVEYKGKYVVKSIGVYDYGGKRSMQIDFTHSHNEKGNEIRGPHVHFGYEHEIVGLKKGYDIKSIPVAEALANEVLEKFANRYH